LNGQTSKPEDKYDFTEEELLDILKQVKSWKKQLAKHPESPDFIELQKLEQHLTRRVEAIVTKRYWLEKGLA